MSKSSIAITMIPADAVVYHVRRATTPSYNDILVATIFQTVSRKLRSVVDDPADAWPADDVCGSSGRISVLHVFRQDSTEIYGRLRLVFAEKIYEILPKNVSTTFWLGAQCIWLAHSLVLAL